MLDDKAGRFEEIITRAAAPCEAKIIPTMAMDPAPFPEEIVSLVENAAASLGMSCLRLPSGAFHDALYAARACPSGMIFVPCRDGLSHHPDEWCEPAHCAAGARVLTASLVQLANE